METQTTELVKRARSQAVYGQMPTEIVHLLGSLADALESQARELAEANNTNLRLVDTLSRQVDAGLAIMAERDEYRAQIATLTAAPSEGEIEAGAMRIFGHRLAMMLSKEKCDTLSRALLTQFVDGRKAGA